MIGRKTGWLAEGGSRRKVFSPGCSTANPGTDIVVASPGQAAMCGGD